jgi:hypothetical protein
MKKPYAEVHVKYNQCIRVFRTDLPDEELVWHRDREDRTVEVLVESDWKLQIEDSLPVTLEKCKKYFIPKGIYHRVVKGTTDLIVKITKHELDIQK